MYTIHIFIHTYIRIVQSYNGESNPTILPAEMVHLTSSSSAPPAQCVRVTMVRLIFAMIWWAFDYVTFQKKKKKILPDRHWKRGAYFGTLIRYIVSVYVL